MDRELDKTTKNDDGPSGQNHNGGEPSGQNRNDNKPSGQNRHGDEPPKDSDAGYSNPTGEDHLVWVTPPVLLSETDGPRPDFAGGM